MKTKKLTGLIVVLLFSFLLFSVAYARDTSYEETLALELKNLGLFQGVSDTNFDLNRAPTRVEALVMLIRTLGKEKDAINNTWTHPFTDVPSWANNYVGYAYNNNLTKGMSEDKFGVSNATSQMYLTFVLRSLGYDDTNQKDFSYNDPYTLSKSIGILTDRVNISEFLRADAVIVSYASLDTKVNGLDAKLYEKLIASGTFTEEQYKLYYKHSLNSTSTTQAPNTQTSTSITTSNSSLSAKDISDKCSSAVFHIDVYGFNGSLIATGSGFFITEDGWAITNHHVATNSSFLVITTTDGNKYDSIRIVDYDLDNDVVLFKVDGGKFNYINLGTSESISQGQKVYAIGSPLGLSNTLSEGIISNVKRELGGKSYFQISVPIDHGSSGGILLDENGNGIGITTAGKESSADLNFAVPIDVVKKLKKSDTENMVLWGDYYYPGYTTVFDFGQFTSAKLISVTPSKLGYSYNYDLKDFHDNFGVPASEYLSTALSMYQTALARKGFEFESLNGSPINGVYTNYESSELLSILVDFQNEIINIVVEYIPTTYSELNTAVPDLGEYMGLEGQKSTNTTSTMLYTYRWYGYYTFENMLLTLQNYMDVLTTVYGFQYVPGTDQYQFSFVKGNVMISIFAGDNNYITMVGDNMN